MQFTSSMYMKLHVLDCTVHLYSYGYSLAPTFSLCKIYAMQHKESIKKCIFTGVPYDTSSFKCKDLRNSTMFSLWYTREVKYSIWPFKLFIFCADSASDFWSPEYFCFHTTNIHWQIFVQAINFPVFHVNYAFNFQAINIQSGPCFQTINIQWIMLLNYQHCYIN